MCSCVISVAGARNAIRWQRCIYGTMGAPVWEFFWNVKQCLLDGAVHRECCCTPASSMNSFFYATTLRGGTPRCVHATPWENAISCPIISGGGNLGAKKKKNLRRERSPSFPVWLIRIRKIEIDWRMEIIEYKFIKKIYLGTVNFLIKGLLKIWNE